MHRSGKLYVPGSEERKLAKAQTLGADAVILDRHLDFAGVASVPPKYQLVLFQS